MKKHPPFQAKASPQIRRTKDGNEPFDYIAGTRLEKRKIEFVPEHEVDMEIEKMRKKGWTHVGKGKHYGKFNLTFARKT
jgi:hypothetical protein